MATLSIGICFFRFFKIRKNFFFYRLFGQIQIRTQSNRKVQTTGDTWIKIPFFFTFFEQLLDFCISISIFFRNQAKQSADELARSASRLKTWAKIGKLIVALHQSIADDPRTFFDYFILIL